MAVIGISVLWDRPSAVFFVLLARRRNSSLSDSFDAELLRAGAGRAVCQIRGVGLVAEPGPGYE